MQTAPSDRATGAGHHNRRPIVFAGDIYCDLVFSGVALPEPGTEVFSDGFALSAGGVATRAVAAGRLGADALVVSRIGDDPIGQFLLGRLRSQEPNLDLSWVEQLDNFQTPLSAALTGPDERSFITYLQTREDPHPVRPLPECFAVQVGAKWAGEQWVRDCRRAGALICGGVGWDATGQWSEQLVRELHLLDIFIANEAEATAYTRTTDCDAALQILSKDVAVAIITRGGQGAIARDSATGETVRVAAPRVRAVDPTGAGDVFTAAFLAAYAFGASLAAKISFAVGCSAISVTGLGGAASAPHRHDLAPFFATHAPELDRELLGLML